MKIKLGSAEDDADYIRHACTETLKAIGITPQPAWVEPQSVAKYVLAYNESDLPIGLGESVVLGDVYDRYDQSPHSAICDLERYCPIQEMAFMKTVYAEPDCRGTSSIFLGLALGSAKLFHGMGARFALASTSESADGLKRLYTKLGAELAGEGRVKGVESALFVFDLDRLLAHRAMQRISKCFEFEQAAERVMS